MILRTLKIGLIVAILVNVYSCTGQNPSPNKLSQDFAKSTPFFYKMPTNVSAIDTSPVWNQKNQQILLTGTIFEADSKTPAPNVLVYYYHTNSSGLYPTDETEERNMPKNQLGQTHGYIRGWVKSNTQGQYSIYTTKPGAYPSRQDPAHIHLYVKDQQMELPYYIDNFVFDNDPLLTSQRRRSQENRGGSGIVRFAQLGDLQIGERNIILGLNVPNYPKSYERKIDSGKNIGEDLSSFAPFHAFGPDKGSTACPICKYGWYHGILYFVGNHPDWTGIEKWLAFLEAESNAREEFLKVYFVYAYENNYNKSRREKELEALGEKLKLSRIALTFVPSFSDERSEIHHIKINPEVESTLIIYKRSNIMDKYIDLKPTKANFNIIRNTLDQSTNEYFKLSRAKQN